MRSKDVVGLNVIETKRAKGHTLLSIASRVHFVFMLL